MVEQECSKKKFVTVRSESNSSKFKHLVITEFYKIIQQY